MRRFFWWCAGVDEDLIQQCTKQEQAKYARMGATVVFTGIFAAFAGGYAMYTVFKNDKLEGVDSSALLLAVVFGLFWGAMIFNLDSYIITSFSKSSNPQRWRRFLNDVWQAVPRLLIAVVIAFTISKPLEIKICERRLAEQIRENKEAKIKASKKDWMDAYDIEGQKAGINVIADRINKADSLKYTDPPIIAQLKEKLNEKKDSIDSENSKINKAKIEIQSIKNTNSSYIYITDSLGNKLKTNRLRKEPEDRINSLNSEISNSKKNKSAIETRKTEISKRIEDERTAYRKNKQRESDSLQLEKTAMVKKYENDTIMVNDRGKESEKIIEDAYTNNFITQLEALSELKRANIKDGDTELQKQEKEKAARSFRLISLALTLLFLVIELAPILTKLITRRSKYEKLVDLDENKADIEIEANLNICKKENEARALVEVEENKDVFARMAEAQSKLLEVAINEWREEELKKIKENPSNYIKSNTSAEA